MSSAEKQAHFPIKKQSSFCPKVKASNVFKQHIDSSEDDHSNSSLGRRLQGSAVPDDLIAEDDSGDENPKERIKRQILRQQQQINLRKVTADFNNYHIESTGPRCDNQFTTPIQEREEEKATSPAFPVHEEKVFDEPAATERRQSFTDECDSELKEIITVEILKKVSRIYSVQFHNIECEEIYGKIISFKFDQSFSLNPQTNVVSVSQMRKFIEYCAEQDTFPYGPVKLVVKEKLSNYHCIVDIEY